METPLFQVDAFTDRPFAGNPAAVCLLPEKRDDEWMQAVAAEMNLSETAFLLEQDDGYRLRWFTPRIEVDLCGHATLASAHVLWTEDRVPLDEEIHFHTNSGLLKACRRGDVSAGRQGRTMRELAGGSRPQPWPWGSSRGRGLAYGCLLATVSHRAQRARVTSSRASGKAASRGISSQIAPMWNVECGMWKPARPRGEGSRQ